VQRNGPLPRKVKAVVDCAYGVASVIAVDTCSVWAPRSSRSSVSQTARPHHHPDPTVVENLRDLQARSAVTRRSWGSPSTATVIASARWTTQGRPRVRRSAAGAVRPRPGAPHGSGPGGDLDVKCSEVRRRELTRAGSFSYLFDEGVARLSTVGHENPPSQLARQHLGALSRRRSPPGPDHAARQVAAEQHSS